MPDDRDIAKLLHLLIPRTMWLVRAEMRRLSAQSLTIPQLRVMAHIQQGFKIPSVLADLQGVSRPAMTKIVEGLVKRGLVARLPTGDDRRQSELGLTKKGEVTLRELTGGVEDMLLGLISKATSKQKRALGQGLKVLESLLAANA